MRACDPFRSGCSHLSDTGTFATVDDVLLARRLVLGGALGMLLGACTPGAEGPTEDPDRTTGDDVSDGGGVSDAGGASGGGAEGEGTEEVMNDPIDALISKNSYDSMTVTPVSDGALTSWDITYLTGGVPVLRYRLQGAWDEESPQADGYQRLEEVRALEGAPSHQGEILMPRSNWEFAFQIDIDGDKQFVPYHGTPTAFAAAPSEVTLDGASVDPASLAVGAPIAAASFALAQTVFARHPARGDADLVEISTITT